MKYAKPPKKSTRNKAQRPKETHNPAGEIDHVKSYTQSEMEVFDNLGEAKEDIKETYLASFLACCVMDVIVVPLYLVLALILFLHSLFYFY